MTFDEASELITGHLQEHAHTIITYMWMSIEKEGHKVELLPEDSIWNAALKITSKDKEQESQFFFYNALLEIFTVDRDDDPMEYDFKIEGDETYLTDKIDSVLDSRLTLIFGILNGESIEDIYNNNEEMFERVRFKKVDLSSKEETIK